MMTTSVLAEILWQTGDPPCDERIGHIRLVALESSPAGYRFVDVAYWNCLAWFRFLDHCQLNTEPGYKVLAWAELPELGGKSMPTEEKVITIEESIFRNYLSALRQAGDDVRALQAELHAIGAIKTEDGEWLYPFYLDGEDRYLPRDMWIQARKDIGKHVQVMSRDGGVPREMFHGEGQQGTDSEGE